MQNVWYTISVIKGDNTMITGVEALRKIQTICITESKS